jgi:hypothetical protein
MATIARSDLFIRDPFVVPLPAGREYLLVGTTDRTCWAGPGVGFDCYRSADLETWSGPVPAFRPPPGFWATEHFWAPEAHAWRGKWYLFASFHAPGAHRGTQILVADAPQGPYVPLTAGPVTPRDWECLDGTFHVDRQGRPWIVFCHEWVQIGDGTVCAMPLSDDLGAALAPPVTLFAASSAAWTVAARWNDGTTGKITDGPFLHRTAGGALIMLWSSLCASGYALAVARSASGDLPGPWIQQARPLFAEDGGHGMLFRAFDGGLRLAIHRPNAPAGAERPVFFPVRETADGLELLP